MVQVGQDLIVTATANSSDQTILAVGVSVGVAGFLILLLVLLLFCL